MASNLTVDDLGDDSGIRKEYVPLHVLDPCNRSKSKKRKRLRKDSETNNEDIVEEIEEGGDTKKGSAVVDEYISDKVKAQYHVLQQGDEIYDATLNHFMGNNNKFYIIQALESNDGSTFMVYSRWGRIGLQGLDKLHGPYTCVDSAVREFKNKFNEQTKRKQFDVQGNLRRKLEVQLRETKLENRIAEFISLICNASIMEKQMKELGYNAKRRPFHMFSKYIISTGYEVLKKIVDVIGQKNTKKLQQLSEDFYTIIPRHIGQKEREFAIDTPQKLKFELKMEDPLLSSYESLHCELTPIEVDSKEFHMIKTYMKNTHGETHSNYTCEIVQIFRASRHGEVDRFNEFSNTNNRMLLWHGSRLTNWVGILSEGLRINVPPKERRTTNTYGKGLYFADMFSKSANYCRASEQASDGVLLLCEVALGEMNEQLRKAKRNAHRMPRGKLSTKGVGATAPDMSMSEILEDGVVVPLGHPKKQMPKVGLLYNEYVVYNVNQIRMRYIVHVDFNFVEMDK